MGKSGFFLLIVVDSQHSCFLVVTTAMTATIAQTGNAMEGVRNGVTAFAASILYMRFIVPAWENAGCPDDGINAIATVSVLLSALMSVDKK